MSDIVLDASAVLALVHGEPGQTAVAEALPDAVISSVNLSEVVAKLAERGRPAEMVRVDLDGLLLTVYPFDEDDAYTAGFLRKATQAAGLSFGDRACLGLALRLGAPVLTADRAWARLDLGIDIRPIR